MYSVIVTFINAVNYQKERAHSVKKAGTKLLRSVIVTFIGFYKYSLVNFSNFFTL